MAILSTLKLVSAKRPANVPPVIQRRNKLLKALFEQVQLATAQVEGRVYAPTKRKTVKNVETGEAVSVSAPKRVKQWWFVSDNGKVNLSLRYGAKALALNSKGANAIELNDTAQVLQTLELLVNAVEAGEMDAAIEAVSVATRKQFK